MREHLDSLLLPAKLDQGCDRIQRVEKEVRLQLHLQSPQVSCREFFLQFERVHRGVLRAHLKFDNSYDSYDETIDQQFEANSIKVQLTCQGRPHRAMSTPIGYRKSHAAQGEQMNGSKH